MDVHTLIWNLVLLCFVNGLYPGLKGIQRSAKFNHSFLLVKWVNNMATRDNTSQDT